tara:strand:- start:16968 stop:17720 length:753 start_codon:yes stop_codon:yes gene_type:complete
MISVIMSVYNGEKTIANSINSILNQTFTDYEFIIIDDGSTDKTCKIIKNFKDKRIKFFTNKKNIGLTKVLNLAISKSKYDLIARQDADDISCKERFNLQLQEFKKDKNLVLLGSKALVRSKNKSFVTKNIDNIRIKNILKYQNVFIHSSIMIKKKEFEKINFYNEKFKVSQDYDAWLRISLFNNYKIKIINKVLVVRNIESSSVSLKKNFNQAYNSYIVRKKHINIFINLLLSAHQYFTNIVPIKLKFYK